MSDRKPSPMPGSPPIGPGTKHETNPLILIDECLSTLPETAPQHGLLYKIRHQLLQESISHEQREAEIKKLQGVVEKLTAPANRIGTLLDLPGDGVARIAVGGSEFYANIDPRLKQEDLQLGCQILVNEAYVLIDTIGLDRNGQVVKIKELLPDGRIRLEGDAGRPGQMLVRGSTLREIDLKPGDEIRLDPTQRLAIERLDPSKTSRHVLDETPTVTWNQIGGQQAAIDAIRRAIEYPLLHADTFRAYQFSQPKGFLLYGPPGCGKTLIGQATAASLAQVVARERPETQETRKNASCPPITGGTFLHVKGPEVLNMWVGESERIIRDLFHQARDRRKDGLLPFLFIDEAESILGTRRALRSYNISNTLVPMFCAELDGIDSLQDVVVILASNRPDLIDPAVLRPGRIDRKIKVARPGRDEAVEIMSVYFSPTLPLNQRLLREHDGDQRAAYDFLVQEAVAAVFSRTDDNRVLSIRLRNGKQETLYRRDLISGAILASIIRRAKERAIERTIQEGEPGLTWDDLLASISDEFQEGEILPPDDSAEEWLKLLDHHPDQVVGISSFRKGRASEERAVRAII